jgi:MFS family permease
VALGAAPDFGLGVAAVLVMGMGFLGVVAVLNTTVQVLVAERMRGRVLSLWSMLLTTLLPLGALLEGSLSDVVGMRTVALTAGAVVALTGVALLARPATARHLDEHGHRLRIRAEAEVIESPGAIAPIDPAIS